MSVAAGAAEVSYALAIANGRVPENMRLIRVKQNDVVKLEWSTDKPISVHLHGYDIEKDVKPGTVTRDDLHGARDRTIHGRTPRRKSVRRTHTRGRPCYDRGLSVAAPCVRRAGGCRRHRMPGDAGARPRLRPTLRSADPALVLPGRHGGGGRGLVRHRRAVRAGGIARAAVSAPRPPRGAVGADGSRARRSRWRSSFSRSPLSSSRSSPGSAATRIPTRTSRPPWCGSSGGSASPMCRPSSATSGR